MGATHTLCCVIAKWAHSNAEGAMIVTCGLDNPRAGERRHVRS